MLDTDEMIKEIMKPKFKTIELNNYKKYENKNFLIIKNNKNIIVIDNRFEPPQIHSNLSSALEKIKQKRNCYKINSLDATNFKKTPI